MGVLEEKEKRREEKRREERKGKVVSLYQTFSSYQLSCLEGGVFTDNKVGITTVTQRTLRTAISYHILSFHLSPNQGCVVMVVVVVAVLREETGREGEGGAGSVDLVGSLPENSH